VCPLQTRGGGGEFATTVVVKVFLLQTRGGEVVTATETLVNHFSRGFAVAVVVVVVIIITIYQFCGALAVKMSAREKPLTNCYGIASF